MDEIKPCPFCGDPMKRLDRGGADVWVEHFGASAATCPIRMWRYPLEAWNRRAPVPASAPAAAPEEAGPVVDEMAALRAKLAEVTAERDRLRVARVLPAEAAAADAARDADIAEAALSRATAALRSIRVEAVNGASYMATRLCLIANTAASALRDLRGATPTPPPGEPGREP